MKNEKLKEKYREEKKNEINKFKHFFCLLLLIIFNNDVYGFKLENSKIRISKYIYYIKIFKKEDFILLWSRKL